MVLVVEDNPDNMITVKALLNDKYHVVEAVNGNEGILMAKDRCFDLSLASRVICKRFFSRKPRQLRSNQALAVLSEAHWQSDC